jgi:hypothetical protein
LGKIVQLIEQLGNTHSLQVGEAKGLLEILCGLHFFEPSAQLDQVVGVGQRQKS